MNVRKVKQDVALQVVKELNPVSFAMKKDGWVKMGFIAQSVRKVCNKYDVDLPLYGKRDGYYTIPYMNYIPLVVAAMQRQQKDIDQLKLLVGKEK